MKLIKPDIKIEKSQHFKSSNFSADASGWAVIFGMLRDKLYSDKIKAVLREYGTNAVDAHVDSGIRDRPIEVTLPNKLEPYLKIRDFGKGLDEDGIRNVFCMYAKSTKTDSNEFNGQMGLGSKSGFAYSDFWQVTSIIDGVKSEYSMYIDETQLGECSLMHREETDEPSGLMITIPVKDEDCETFKIIALNLYRDFAVTPILKGTTDPIVKFIPYNEITNAGHLVKFITPTTVYGRHNLYTGVYAIMGNVSYPIDMKHFSPIDQYDKNAKKGKYNLDTADYNLVTKYGTRVEIDFNIGDLQVSISRESLEYHDNVKAKIFKVLNGLNEIAIESLLVHQRKTNSNIAHLWSAITKSGLVNQQDYFDIIKRLGMSQKNVKKTNWGIETYTDIKDLFKKAWGYHISYNGDSRSFEHNNLTALDSYVRYFGIDLPVKEAHRRIRSFIRKSQATSSPILTFECDDYEPLKKKIEEHSHADFFMMASELPDPDKDIVDEADPVEKVKYTYNITPVPTDKRTAIYFTPNEDFIDNSSKNKNWDIAVPDLTGKEKNYYWPIYSFKLSGTLNGVATYEFCKFIADLKKAKIIDANDKVYGVKLASEDQAIADGMIHLKTLFIEPNFCLGDILSYTDGAKKSLFKAAKDAGVLLGFDINEKPSKSIFDLVPNAGNYVVRPPRPQSAQYEKIITDTIKAIWKHFPLTETYKYGGNLNATTEEELKLYMKSKLESLGLAQKE